MKPSKSIVVPCYNEAENLPGLLRRFDALRAPTDDWELVVVDNGSTDGTASLLADELTQGRREYLRVVSVSPPNRGYGHGIMEGLRAARGSLLAWTHADGQTPPGDALEALELLAREGEGERTFVKGRRRGRSIADRVFTLGMQVAVAVQLRIHLSDINGQPKAFPRALLDLAVCPPDDLSLDLYFLWLAQGGRHGYRLRTFDVQFLAREHGESRWAYSWNAKLRAIQRTLSSMRVLARQARRT